MLLVGMSGGLISDLVSCEAMLFHGSKMHCWESRDEVIDGLIMFYVRSDISL